MTSQTMATKQSTGLHTTLSVSLISAIAVSLSAGLSPAQAQPPTQQAAAASPVFRTSGSTLQELVQTQSGSAAQLGGTVTLGDCFRAQIGGINTQQCNFRMGTAREGRVTQFDLATLPQVAHDEMRYSSASEAHSYISLGEEPQPQRSLTVRIPLFP